MKHTFFFSAIIFLLADNNATAQLTVSHDTTICAGQTVQLSVSGGTTYTWSPSNSLSSSTSANPVAAPSQTTTYIVSSPLSNANLVVNGDFSQGNTGFTSSYTYVVPQDTLGERYYFVGTNGNSWNSGMSSFCSDHTSNSGMMLIANGALTTPTPVWIETLSVAPNCTYTLSAYFSPMNQYNYPKMQWMVNGTAIGNAASALQVPCVWTHVQTTWNSGSNTTATFSLFDPLTVGNGNDFSLDDITITGSGTAYDTVTVTVATPPYVNLGSDTSFCGSGTVLLNAQNPGSTYLWSDGSTQQVLSANASGTYSVTVTNSNLCSASSSINISSSTVGSVAIAAPVTQICADDSTQICVQNPSAFTAFHWNTNASTACIQATLAGNYYVTATDQNGCTAESNHLSVSVYSSPPVSLSVNGDTLSSYNASSYQWFFNGSQLPNATSNVYVAQQSGNYFVQITDSNGCKAVSTSVPVTVLGINDLNDDETISVYPNPNSVGSWQLAVSDEWIGSVIEITDVNGRVVFKSEIRSPKSEVNTNLQSGVYLLRIISAEKSYSKKLIKVD